MHLRNPIPLLMAIAMTLVGFINFLTGVLPLFQTDNEAQQEIARYSHYFSISSAQHTSELFAILLGVVLILLGLGLYHRKRTAWMWSFVFLFIAFVNSVYGKLDLQNTILSIGYIALLIIFRKEFQVRSHQPMPYAQVISWLSVLFAIGYGMVGSYFLRQQFHGIHTWLDSIYFTLVTYSTLGYGDIYPKTPDAKLFVISMVIIGVSSFVAALTMLFGPMIENRIKGVLTIMNKFKNIRNHVVICGYSPMSIYAAHRLTDQNTTCLFILHQAEYAPSLEQQGFQTLVGDATTKDTLESANLAKAQALISAFDSDADNILTVMTAETIRKENGAKFKIISRIDQKQNISKAKQVGADEVISPAILGGEMMATEALNP